MKTGAINSNYSTNFKANIKFADVHFKSPMVLDNCDKAYANRILDKLKAYHPKDTIIIGKKVDNIKGDVIYAINSRTGYEITEEAKLGRYDGLPGSNVFYKLLENILNPTLMVHNDFWAKNKNGFPEIITEPKRVSSESPLKHSIFLDRTITE